MLNKLGYQALFDFEDAFEAIEFGIKQGFKCVELNQTNPVFFPEKYSAKQRKKLKNCKFPILLHAPESLSLFNLHKNVLSEILERIFEIIDFAKEIDAQGVTLHLGATFTISIDGKGVWIHEILHEEYRKTLEYSLIKLKKYARNKTRLCIENTSGLRYGFAKKTVEKLLTDKKLWLTWDIGHTNRLGNKKIDKSLFVKFIRQVNTVHVHDNHGREDEHIVPGSGNIDFKYYFEILKPVNPYLILETRPKKRAIESLKYILPVLKKLG